MIVVSDTSPLCYLILIGYDALVPRLFGQLTIPTAVSHELAHPDAPEAVRHWIAQPPDWLVVRVASGEPAAAWRSLHAGERETLMLGHALHADLLLLDETAARAAAADGGLDFTGLLGVLSHAATEGLVDLPEAIMRLRGTTFRAAPRLLKSLLDRHHAP